MSKQLALFICVIFIVWLFYRERTLNPMTSMALWVALLWMMILGSRPVSAWLGNKITSPDVYLEGSPLDRNVFLFLIAVALVVLLRRRLDWTNIFLSNRWFFLFFLYCSISIVWSDYPFVSLKRWIKDAGNVIMVLLVLTESDPDKAIRAVFSRLTYLLLPLSVLLIKHFPELGRSYNRWTWEVSYIGVATEKNALGSIAFISGLYLIWHVIEMRTEVGQKADSMDFLGHVILLLMVLWLMGIAGSSTALVCLIIGIGIFLYMRLRIAKSQIRYLGTYSILIGILILFLYSIPGVAELFVGILGRDLTLTGRTDIWAEALKSPFNPLFGAGYQNYWLSYGRKHFNELGIRGLNQAHNGYLETYLDGGMVGLFFLIAMIISTLKNLKKELSPDNSIGILCSVFLVVAVVYNWTEAMFNRQSLVWVIMLFAVLNYSKGFYKRRRERYSQLGAKGSQHFFQ